MKIHNNSTVTTEPSLHYKMYKAGKLWMYAGIMGVAVTGATLINNGTAHADTTTGDTTSASSSSDTYTKIATPDSTVTNAASAATNAGATVTSTTGTTYNVSGASELAKAQSAVAQDYASQSQDLANVTAQAQRSSATATEIASTNEQIESAASALKATGATATQGDTKPITSVDQVSQMKSDAQTQISQMNSMASETTAVSNATAEANATVKSAADAANAVPGLTVTASGKPVSVSSVAQAQQLANQQKETIEAAVKEQEKNNVGGHNLNTIDSSQISQELELNTNPNATIKILNKSSNVVTAEYQGNGKDGYVTGLTGDTPTSTSKSYLNVATASTGDSYITVEYDNLSGLKYGNIPISKLVTTYKWYSTHTGDPSSADVYKEGNAALVVLSDPANGFWYNNQSIKTGGAHNSEDSWLPANSGVTVTYTIYDNNGNPITIGDNAWLTFSSLNMGGHVWTENGVPYYGWSDSSRFENVAGSDSVTLKNLYGSIISNNGVSNQNGTVAWAVAPTDQIAVGKGTNNFAFYGSIDNGKTNGLYHVTLDTSDGGMHYRWIIGDKIVGFDSSDPSTWWNPIAKAGYYYWDGSNNHNDVQYVGSAVGLIKPGSTSFTITAASQIQQNSDKSATNGTWFILTSVIPKTPKTTITYDKYVPKPQNDSYQYHLYNSEVTTPSATYHLDSIYYGQGTDTKEVSDIQHGKITDVNGQQLTTGDQVTYKITADSLPAGRVNDISNLTFSDTLPDGMSVNDAKMVDTNGNDVSGNFTKSINGNAVSFTATSDYSKALNADKPSVAKLPVMEIVATVTKDSATLKNQAIVLVNNNSVTTNTTVNTSGTSTPKKSETANGGSQDANEKTLQRGDTINYKVDLDYKDIKTSTAISDAQKAKGLSFSDTYDSKTTAEPETAKLVTADGTELPSEMYTLTWGTANHTVTGKITDVDSFIKAYGGQVLSLKFDAAINKDVKDSEKVYNTAYQINFGQTYQTNTVWNKVDVPNPTKSETVDDNTEDGNGKYVVVGDTIKYTVTVDYSGVKASELTKDALSKEWSITDNYDAKTTADQNSIQLLDTSGNTIDSSNDTVNWDTQNHTVKLTFHDPASFLAKYGDQVLKLKFNAKVNEDVKDGDEIKNTAFQTNAGHTYQTNTVTNKVSNPDPKKDVVVSVNNTKSLDKSTINLGDTFDYVLEGVTIPQNYGGTLSEYGFSDDYDQAHDQYNGDYVVLATTDITLKDGTVLKKGTNLTKYTTQTIDQTNGKVNVEFSKDFFSKIDFAKGGFSANDYLAMKRIKVGTVYNSYINTVNGIGKKSNTVVTNTPEPETPTPESPSTPATPTPTPTAYTPIETPATAVTPAQPQETLPQTGNEGSEVAEVAGAVMLGLVSMATLTGAARRKKREA